MYVFVVVVVVLFSFDQIIIVLSYIWFLFIHNLLKQQNVCNCFWNAISKVSTAIAIAIAVNAAVAADAIANAIDFQFGC